MLNKVIMIGHVGADPEVKSFTNGSITIFNLATSERWKDKATGERKDKTHWHRVVVQQDNLQEIVKKYVKKGSKIYIEGMVAVRSWKDEATGEDKRMVEIAIKGFGGKIVLLDGKNRDDDTPPEGAYAEE